MSKPAPKPTPAAAAASAAAAAAVTAAVAVDLKALAKTMKASMDTAAFGDALAAFSASALAASHATLTAAIEAAHRDAKRQAIMYTVLAFAGLCAAQTKQWSKAEDMYRKATGLQEDQFPAWKGLYDVYTQTGAKDQLRPVLEKLVTAAPAGLKKLGYTSQLLRLQIESPLPSDPPLAAQSASLQTLLSDPLLNASAAASASSGKDDSKDALEIARLRLELRLSSLLAFERAEREDKQKELSVRLERQLKKSREERERADKLRAQQAASKAGAIAAAVSKAASKPGAAPPLTAAEEDAEITRKVGAKLERDWMEGPAHKEAEAIYASILALPAPAAAPGTLDLAHRLVHERILARLVLRASAHSSFTVSQESFDATSKALMTKAREILDLTASSPSAYASRILLGLSWSIGGAGSDDSLRTKLLQQQSFIERCITVFARPSSDPSKILEVEDNFQSYAWMAWHALACSIVSTQTVPAALIALPAPPALQGAIAGLGANPPVWELAEAILKNVSATSDADAAAASATASSSSVIAAPVAAAPVIAALPSPFCPSFLSPVALAYALQHQSGESTHKETLLSVQSALALIKSYRAAQPFDPRATRAATHAELTLASAYLTKTLDERLRDSACRIFLKTLNAQRDASAAADRDTDSLIRSLTGLAQAALLEKPRPSYVKAEAYISELAELQPGQEYVFEMRGVLKLEEARAVKAAASAAAAAEVAGAGASYTVLLQSAASFLQQALALSPSKPSHHLRLGHAYFEQDAAGADGARTDKDHSLKSFQTAAALATAALPSAPRGAAERALQSVASEALAMQGLWWSTVGCDAEQAKKHYIAAMKIDPANDIAGPALCEAILAGGPAKGASKESESARVHAIHALASRATAANPRCVWAWLRLARAQMSGPHPDPATAIVSYQNALRVDNESQRAAQAWQELGECYAAEGQFVAAYKAIAKCVDLTSAAAVATASVKDARAQQKLRSMRLYLLAKSQLNLGGVTEAIRSLEQATASSSSPFLPALRLHAEALYVQSNVLVNAGAFEAATRVLDQAVAMALRCIDVAANSTTAVSTAEEQKQEEKSAESAAVAAAGNLEPRPYISLWKLLGDCYSLYNSLPVDGVLPAAAASAPAAAASVSSASPSLSDLPLCESLKLDYLRRAARAYSKCIFLDPTNAPAWYDLALGELKSALALHAPAPPSPLEASTDDAPPAHELETKHRERGREAAKACLLLSPSNTLGWHLLAVLETRPLVRQHALIQAVTLDAKDCMSWTSLGLVYLQSAHDQAHLGEHESRQVLLGVSRHALEVSQTLDPSNPGLWMAQGMFNQGVGTLEAYVQARACFQRSLELHPSAVARFGLAYTAYCTGELALARFAILKFTAQYPRHASAWNLAGLIYEHVAAESKIGGKTNTAGSQETIELAVEAFARAEELLAVDTQFSTEQRQGELRRMVRTNRARALASAEHYEASITLYQSLIHDAAALGQSGTVSSAAVLAAALTLHVELAMVLARSLQLEQAASIQSTAVAIAASQIEAAPEPGPEVEPERAQQMRHDRSELINKRRGLLLQHAQLLALHGDYDACKQLLQQSVSDHPDYPHPFNYFSVMCVLFASSLAQGDVASAAYALDMARQCMDGLMAGPHSESGEVMSALLPAFLRIQHQLAVVQGDAVRARRCLAKIVHLNPAAMESWNELYRFVLSSATSAASLPLASILSTATWPSLDKVHAASSGGGGSSATIVAAEAAWMARQEIVALSFLAVGRVGSAVAGAAATEAEDEAKRSALESKEAEALFSQGGDEDAEFADEGADVDVRAKGPAVALVLPSSSSSEEDSWPKLSNLNAGRVSAHMLHLNPTSAESWGIQATALYAQAVQAAAVESTAASAAPLFSKAIRMLQLWTSLLSSELTGSKLAQSHQLVAAPTHASLMADLCNCQVMLVDSLMRRAQSTAGSDADAAANDLVQASQLLRSIFDQQASMGDAFPLGSDALQVLAARLALRQGDEAGALRHYRAAIECASLRVDLWEELSEVYANKDMLQTAEACLQSALALVQQAEWDSKLNATASETAQRRLLLRLSMQAYAAQKFERASAWASAAAKGSSVADSSSASAVSVTVGAVGASSPAAFFLLGLSQVALGHPDQAARAFQAALNLHLAAQDRTTLSAAGEEDAPLVAAAANYPMAGLRFQLALGYLRTASSSAAPAGPLGEAQALLHEELAASAGSASPNALAPIYFQLALVAQKMKDSAAAASYLRSAMHLRPDTPLYLRLQAELDAASGGSAASSSSALGPLPTVIPAPESWEDA